MNALELEMQQSRERIALVQRMIADAYRAGQLGLPCPDGLLPPGKSELHRIAETVAQKWDLTPELLRGHERWQPLAKARQEGYALSRKAGYTFPHIGRFYGNRDHSTVMHGVNAHEARQSGVA